MIKVVALIDTPAVTVMPFEEIAEDAAANDFEFYEEYFAPGSDENYDYIDAHVQYDVTKEFFQVRILIVQNPFKAQVDIKELTDMWLDVAKRAVAKELQKRQDDADIPF